MKKRPVIIRKVGDFVVLVVPKDDVLIDHMQIPSVGESCSRGLRIVASSTARGGNTSAWTMTVPVARSVVKSLRDLADFIAKEHELLSKGE